MPSGNCGVSTHNRPVPFGHCRGWLWVTGGRCSSCVSPGSLANLAFNRTMKAELANIARNIRRTLFLRQAALA